MRIRGLILTLIAAVMGGAVVVGVLSIVMLTELSHAERESGTASADFQRVEALVRNSQELLGMLDILTSESSGAFVLAERLSRRCREDIRRLGASAAFAMTHHVDNLETMLDEALHAAAAVETAEDPELALDRYDETATSLLNALEELETHSQSIAERDALRVSNQRSRVPVTLTVATLIYVAMVSAIARWMLVRLVGPVQRLADAAKQSMRLDEPFQLEPNGPHEVRALTRSIGEFVSSLESKVRARTKELRDSELKSQTLLERSPVCIKVIDLDSRLQFMSAAGIEDLKIPDITSFYGCIYPPAIYPESMQRPLIEHLDRAKAGEICRVETPVLDCEGCEIWYDTTFVPTRDNEGQIEYIIATSVNVTERKAMEEELRAGNASMAEALKRETAVAVELERVNTELEQLASTDKLTDLPNREVFVDRLRQIMKRSRRDGGRFAVLFFDFDRFKVVNDSLGHDVGDALLCDIAEIFRREVCESDTVARFGGDEFVVLLTNLANFSDADLKAETLLHAFARPHQLGDHLVISNASIGLVTNERDYERPGDMIRDADAAMYQAKENGRAQVVVFDRAMHASAMDRLLIEADLHVAVANDQLRLLFQPIVELDTGQVAGFEALLRWEHPTRGTISPLDFIPIAEDTGLIIPIGEWVLTTAAAQLADWNQTLGRDRTLKVNVNVSKRQLLDPSFLADAIDCQRDYDLQPGQLQLEITESTIADDRSDVASLLRELREHGFPIAMDDFGTGVSSLGTLHKFPIDVLKIDQTFIRVLDHDRSLLAVVASITNLAENLGIQTVAEGIETVDIVGALQSIGCTWGQGYYFAKPLPPSDVNDYLLNGCSQQDPRAA